jgi:hypothetical protein
MELIYSRQATDFIKGRAYSNPRFYSAPRRGVTKVFLVGEWPKIEADYRALGVPVERLDEAAVSAKPQPEPSAEEALARLSAQTTADERAKIYIPDDWRGLPWTRPAEGRDLTLRGLGAMFSDAPVINKAQAVAAITAELARRAA